ncbi:MAG: hypothetical protein GTO18_03530 [Anaerolineales bacterium]|nr:hypothetical protein [Anaerolineales bacterium]
MATTNALGKYVPDKIPEIGLVKSTSFISGMKIALTRQSDAKLPRQSDGELL